MHLGGGISIGDFNNDYLRHFYFTENVMGNSLYIIKENLLYLVINALHAIVDQEPILCLYRILEKSIPSKQLTAEVNGSFSY